MVTIMTIMAVAMIVSACDGSGSQGTNSEYHSTKMRELGVIPWVECNWPDVPVNKADPHSSSTFEHTVKGLEIWKSVTGTAIVTTLPGKEALYPRLRDRVPGMRIIPGLKTKDLLVRLDSVEGWKAVAREVLAIQDKSGERVVLLENEKAVYPFIRGEQAADMDQLRKALDSLPKDNEYLWYPSIFGKEEEQKRCAEVCGVVQEVLLNVRFLDQRFQGKRAVSDRTRKAADLRLMKIAKRPTLRMAYFYGPDHPHVWWNDDQIFQALSQLRSGRSDSADVVLYPGLKRWVEAARSLSERLTSPPAIPVEP